MNNKLKCSALMVLLLGSGSMSFGSDVPYLKVNESIKNYRTANYTKPAVQKVSLNSTLTKNLNPSISKIGSDSGIRLAAANEIDINSGESRELTNEDLTSETTVNNSGNASGSTLTNQGAFNNVTEDSTANFTGVFTNGSDSNSSASVENNGSFSAADGLTNYGSVTNNKTFSAGDVSNKGTINNSGEGTTFTASSVTNDGQINNRNNAQYKVTGDVVNNTGIENDSTSTYEVNGKFTNNGSGEKGVDNKGTFNVGGETENNGSIVNDGSSAQYKATGSVTNNSDGTIDNKNGASFETNSDLSNSGNLNNESSSSLTVGGNLTNDGKSSDGKGVTNNGTITVTGKNTNSGDITNNNSYTAGSNSNSGTITNGGSYSVSGNDENSGTVTNNSSYTVDGNFTNKSAAEGAGNGSIVNNNGAEFSVKEAIENEAGASVTNEGTFTGSSSLTNNGTFTNRNGGKTDLGSLTNSGIFDNSAETTVSGDFNNTGSSENGIKNSGTFNVTGEANNSGDITSNGGTSSFNGSSTSNSGNITNNNGSVNFNQSTTNNGTITNTTGTMNFGSTLSGSGSGSIKNSGNMNLSGDASNYKGSYNQTGGSLTVNNGSSFFGGTSTVSSGDFNWKNTDGTQTVEDLHMEGGNLNITEGGQLTLGGSSSIKDAVNANITEGTSLTLQGTASAELGSGDTWNGDVVLSGGTLTLYDDLFGAGKSNKGTLSATSGTLDLQSDFTFSGSGTSVGKEVALNIGDGKTTHLKGGANLTIDDTDTWSKGKIQIDDADSTLNVEGVIPEENNGTIVAEQGNVNFKENSGFTLDGGTIIGKEAKVNIESESNLTIGENGNLYLGDDDTWTGNVNLTEGTLQYGKQNPIDGTLNATGGTLSLVDGSTFTLQNSGASKSTIEDAVIVEINDGTTLKVSDGTTFNMDSADYWAGLVDVEANGTLNAKGVDNTKAGGGIKQVTGGKSVFSEGSNVVVTDSSSSITGGTVELKDKSKLTYGGGQKFQADDLIIEDGSTFGIMNGAIDSATSDEVQAGGEANFTFDISQRQYKSDNFDIGKEGVKLAEGVDSGNLHIADFNLLGDCPVDRNTKFQFFNIGESEIPEGIEFTATEQLKRTPSGWFGLNPIAGEPGAYNLYLAQYVPEEFRGEAAILGMYTNQLQVNDIVTNHFILHDATLIDNAKSANKYSAASPLFAPYQTTYTEGGIWSKSYASFDRMDLTQGLSVGNNTYGTLLGADLPAVELNKDWTFIPTGYVGYNGAHQYFDGVSSYQNGGQLGVMGTFIKNEDFITSVLAYGGGYTNEMSYGGYSDNTGNWFAGSAVKTAYNLHALKDFIVQPNLMVAYNAFGRQNWHSDYGNIDMMTKMFNGINAAPGVNFILSKDTWSLYATFQYMFFMNDKVDASIGNIVLPGAKLEHGVFQYGIGATKTFNDTFATYGQINLRNAGITGIGFQLGLQWLFDLKLPWEHTESKKN